MKTFFKNSILSLTVALLALASTGFCLGQSEYASINPEEGITDVRVIHDSSYDARAYLPDDHRSNMMIDRDPQFAGGNHMLREYLTENFNYPAMARANDIDGRMRVAFDIDENGRVSNVRITEGAHDVLEKELIKTIEAMPEWTPALRYGFPVKCTVELPFKATLL